MNKKIFGLFCLSALALTSCYDEKGEDYTPATPESGAYVYADGDKVSFGATDAQILTIKVGKTEKAGAMTVNLTADNAKFQAPASVTIPDGETSVDVKVPFNITGGTTEQVTFTLSGSTTNYGPSILTMDVFRDFVWVNIGTGLFTSEFFEEAWEQPVLQAEGTQKYRLPDLYVEGYELAFDLTDDGQALAASIPAWQTGYVHPTYGMVSARNLDITGHPLVREGNAITIPMQFIVSAGSFGWGNETIELPE